jgi:hypothetical protein
MRKPGDEQRDRDIRAVVLMLVRIVLEVLNRWP